jgi:hypothetical protein
MRDDTVAEVENMKASTNIPVWAVISVCAALVTPAALAVGGNRCETATFIPGLPFADVGNTCGFQDDYDESCPLIAPGSPDAVYVLTPPADVFVEVSLCAGSDYDTKLYVYRDACQPGNREACDDDSCTTPKMPSPYVSELAFGALPPDTLFGQPPYSPDDSWVFVASELWWPNGSDRMYESFEVPGGTCGIRWAGAMADIFDEECFENPVAFQIAFWEDAGGLPGTAWAIHDVVLEGAPTGIFYGDLELLLWELDLEPLGCVNLDHGWVSIQGTQDPDCFFLWLGSAVGDGASVYWGQAGFVTEQEDLGVCLTGFIGACCLPGDACERMVPFDCMTAGGIYLGDDSFCELGCAPPPNDICQTASWLPVPGEVAASTAMADDDVTPLCGTSSPYQGVWYVVEGTGGLLVASTCRPHSTFDTKIQVFCDCGSLVCVTGNDDTPGEPPECDLHGFNRLSTVEWCSQLGHLYYVKVGGFGINTGHFELEVNDAGPCGPPVECPALSGRCCYPWCPWDCGDGDGTVGIVDFLAMLAQWNGPGPCDVDEQGGVDIIDFLDLLAHWGPCPIEPGCEVLDPATCEMIGGQWTQDLDCDVPCP